MAEFICRLGTPAGEVVTRTVDATGVERGARATGAGRLPRFQRHSTKDLGRNDFDTPRWSWSEGPSQGKRLSSF